MAGTPARWHKRMAQRGPVFAAAANSGQTDAIGSSSPSRPRSTRWRATERRRPCRRSRSRRACRAARAPASPRRPTRRRGRRRSRRRSSRRRLRPARAFCEVAHELVAYRCEARVAVSRDRHLFHGHDLGSARGRSTDVPVRPAAPSDPHPGAVDRGLVRTQVRLDHRRVFQHLGRRALGDDLAQLECDHAVADRP